VQSLLRTGQPFAIPPDRRRNRFYDSVMLDVFAKEPELGRPILEAIFAKNPVQRVLKFLDDRSSVWEELEILRAPQAGPFLRAVGRRGAEMYVH
jgi:lycopene beta-cyclase